MVVWCYGMRETMIDLINGSEPEYFLSSSWLTRLEKSLSAIFPRYVLRGINWEVLDQINETSWLWVYRVDLDPPLYQAVRERKPRMLNI